MNVLLGIEGSDESMKALRSTIDRAAAVGDDLTVAILENPESGATTAEIERHVAEELARFDADASVRVVSGDPGSRLVEMAESEGFDVVALGGGRETPMGKISVGQIAEFVILNARVSVLLVR